MSIHSHPFHFPALLADIARATNNDVAIALARSLGGLRLVIPRAVAADHPLARAVGLKAAAIIAAHFGGQRWRIPSAKPFLHWHDAHRLRDEGKSANEIARALHLNQRHVEKLLEGHAASSSPARIAPGAPEICGACGRRHRSRRAAKACDLRQMELFGSDS